MERIARSICASTSSAATSTTNWVRSSRRAPDADAAGQPVARRENPCLTLSRPHLHDEAIDLVGPLFQTLQDVRRVLGIDGIDLC